MSISKTKTILNLNPESHCRATKGDSIFFRIPRDKLMPSGLRRLQRLEKYNNYKISLLAEAKRNRFTIPASGLCVTFYLPVPKSWSQKKKTLHHGILCQGKYDIDNMIKAFFDSLVAEDKYISNISATKRWVDYPTGWIECSIKEDEPIQALIVPPPKE